MTTKLKSRIKKRITQNNRKMRKEARKLQSLGIRRGPKESKQLHVPNLYPYKKRMIQQIENQKSTDRREKMLAKLTLKSKSAVTNMEIVKEDPIVREKRYLENIKDEKSKF